LPANAVKSGKWWRRLVTRLLDIRFDHEPRVYSISAGADEVLNAAHSCEFHDLWKKYALQWCFSLDRCIRLMLLLHLFQENPEKAIPEATAKSAVKLTFWLVAEHHRVLKELKNEGLVQKRRTDCARMLQKIREKGPLLKRELFRLFEVQTEAVHGPVLADLLRSGEVVKGADGRLRVSAIDEKADKDKSGTMAILPTAGTDTTDKNTNDKS
jgi:hypothetical protein